MGALKKTSDCFIGDFVTAKLRYGVRGEPRQGWIKSWNPFLIVGQSGTVYECKGEPVKVENPPECPKCQGRGDLFGGSLYHHIKIPCPVCQANDESVEWGEDRF